MAGAEEPSGTAPRTLVTGGSGVLGRAIVEALLVRGDVVRVLDLHEHPFGNGRVEVVLGSVTDLGRVREAVESCGAVVHLAARLPQARLDEPALRAVNVGGTHTVAEACLDAGVR